jgi:hypothetical protein
MDTMLVCVPLPGIAVNSQVDLHQAASDCPNCGAHVSGNFCHECGQETVLHPPSTREFVHEFIGHYVALEGRLWKSLGLLLFRPGRLTLEYIKGRRVRYVQPLRLYLTFSLIFFSVMKLGTYDDGTSRVNVGKPPAVSAAGAPADRKHEAAKTRDEPGAILKEDSADEINIGSRDIRDWLRGWSPHVGDKADQFAAMSGGDREKALKTAFYSYVPYAIFFMMPVFAFYLKMLYLGSGRRYGEHLLFALHTNAFAFLAMTLAMLPLVPGIVEFAIWTWLTFYLPTAMRRVYGGSRKLTALRWIVLMLLHLVTLGAAIFLAVAYGTLH